MTRSSTRGRAYRPTDAPPGRHSVRRLGELRATPELASIRTSQTATALVSASLKSVSRRPSCNWRKFPSGSPVWAIRCPSGALNTTVEEPPASGIDSTADGVGPLVKSTRSPSALQLADPFGPRSTTCRGAEPSRGSTHRSRELCLILSSREPSGAEITKSVTGQTAPERRRLPPTNERSQPVHVAVSHAAARILFPSPLQAYTSISRVSAIRCVSPVSMMRI